jgi:hypothetical protein
MTNRLRITNPRELHRVVDLIHDVWLDAEAIFFDSDKSTLNIRYFLNKESSSGFMGRARFPAYECFLRISRVQSYTVQDEQKVRFYDINTIRYDPESKSLKLQTGVPIQIQAVVEDFDLTVEETDVIVNS